MGDAADIITALGTAIAALVVAITGALTVIAALRRADRKQDEIAKQQQEIAEEVGKVHTLVNHGRGIILGVAAVSARTLADRFPDNSSYAQLALEAEESLATHTRQQAIVDSGEPRNDDASTP